MVSREPGVLTQRMVMQLCSETITTPTPFGARISSTVRARSSFGSVSSLAHSMRVRTAASAWLGRLGDVVIGGTTRRSASTDRPG